MDECDVYDVFPSTDGRYYQYSPLCKMHKEFENFVRLVAKLRKSQSTDFLSLPDKELDDAVTEWMELEKQVDEEIRRLLP